MSGKSKRGAPSLHQFIMREAASTGQLKDKPERLTKAQRSMLWSLNDLGGLVQRWQLAVTAPKFRTLESLERAGLLKKEFGALGTHPFVRITPEGRAALAQEGRE